MNHHLIFSSGDLKEFSLLASKVVKNAQMNGILMQIVVLWW